MTLPVLLDCTVAARINLSLRVDPSLLQPRLPDPWQVAAMPSGPHQGMNLRLIFNDVLLNQRADFEPEPGAQDYSAVFVISARRAGSSESRFFNARILHANPDCLPGKYGTSRRAEASRRQVVEARGCSTTVSDFFEFASGSDHVSFSLVYQRGELVRPRPPVKICVSSVYDLGIERYYRQDLLEDVIKSAPSAVDRVLAYRLEVSGPDFGDVFRTSPELISITVNPWYLREVFDRDE